MNPIKCVLLVDDNELVFEIVTMMLEKLGYRVLGAQSSAEAQRIYSENADSVDLVLLDLNLPDESGGELFKKIRNVKPDARVFLLTGDGEQQEEADLLNLGCRGVLQKPITLDKLSEALAKRDSLEFAQLSDVKHHQVIGSAV